MKKITFEDWQQWVWTLKKWQRTLRRRFASLPSLCPREPRTEWRIGSPRYGNIDHTNRAAILRIGAREDGTFRNHMITASARIRHLVYFSITDTECSGVKARFAGLLDSAGR